MQVTIVPTGTFSQGKTGVHYTITVRNNGKVKTNGTVTATITLPTGLTATKLAGSGWNCPAGTLTCSRSDVLNGESNYPIDVTVNVAANAERTLRSTVEVSGGDELDVSNDTGYHDTTVLSSDASLQGLSTTNAVLKETFAPGTLAYTADVPFAVNSLTVKPTVNESHAKVKVTLNSKEVGDGKESEPLDLGVDINTITIDVTAEDGTTKRTYKITVNRAAQSKNANLSDLFVDGTSITGFASDTLAYTVNVPNVTTAVTVTGTKADATASVVVAGGSNLTVGSNTVTVTVTAEDGTKKKTYTITVIRAKSNNANLNDLKINGTSITGFASGKLAYTVNVPNPTTSVTLVGTKADATATVTVTGGSNLIVGDNTVTVKVTAQDGTTEVVYTVTVVRVKSSDASLSDLKVDGTSITGFVPNTLAYKVPVSNATTAVTVTGTKADATASVADAVGGSDLVVGDNKVTVTVTAEDGTVRTYTVTVVRAGSDNASLSDLKVDGTSITGFASGTLAYAVNVPNATTVVTVTGTKADATATVVVAGGSNLTVGSNTVTVTVTAEDGTTKKTYTITIIRAKSNNANLSDLKVDETSIANFAPGTLAYKVNVPNVTTAVTVTGTKADATATVTVTGGSNLIVGDNTVTIKVSAQDGTTEVIYTVTVVRAKSSDASLSDLKVDGASITNFASGKLEYKVNVPNATTAVTVTGTKADATASVADAVGGSDLVVGDNKVTVTVTAQDGTVQTYTVTVVRAGSDNASLSDLKVDETSIAGFASGTLAYTVPVPNATTAVTVTGTKADATATVVVTGGSNLVVGDNKVTVTVTAQNGTTQTYTITVIRAKSNNANLSDLKVDETSIANFAPGTLAYKVNVPNATTAVKVTGTKSDATATVTVTGGSNLIVGDNRVTVTVTAQDGTTEVIYTVTVVRAAQNSDASLSDLKVNGTSITGFAPGRLTYTVPVPNATTAVTVIGTKADAKASVADAVGGSNLIVGSNTVTVTVTAEDGTKKTYTITVVRAKSDNKSFTFLLNTNGNSQEIIWDKATNTASANVTSAVYSATVTGTVYDPASILTINDINVVSGKPTTIDLNDGLNPILVKVTAQDLSVQEYVLNIMRYGNAGLKGLTVSGVDLTPPFNLDSLTYAGSVPYAVSSVTVTASVYDPNATVTVMGLKVVSGTPSVPINLAVGQNEILVRVTPTFGVTQPYTITLTRAASNDVGLAGIVVNNGLVAVTSGIDGKYYATVSESTYNLIVKPQSTDPASRIKVNGVDVDRQGNSNIIPLSYGINEITIVVTSEDGTAQAYKLLVTRQQQDKQQGNGGGGGGPISPQVKVKLIVGDNGNSIHVDVQRERTVNGRVTDRVAITPEVIKQIEEAAGGKLNSLKLVIPQIPEGSDEFMINLPKNTLQDLVGWGSEVSIVTEDVQVTLPKATITGALQLKEELYVRFISNQTNEMKQAAKKRVLAAQLVTKAAGNGKAELLGWPMTIETNLNNQETKLNFSLKGVKIPVDPKERNAFLASLGVYIEHSDGEKELLKGTIQYDAQKNPLSIEIVITKFSTFSLIEIQKTPIETVTYARWTDGYPDGTFQPYQSITRAEAATILVKAMNLPKPLNSLQKFMDVSDSHWAADVIHQVQGAGLLGGYPDGSFKPDAPITRAELAAIIVRLKKLEVAESAQSFTDTKGHWAANYIQTAKIAGLVAGYEDGSFRPDQKLTRAEAVKAMNSLLGRPTPELGKDVWSDVSKKDWFWLDVQSASQSFSNTSYEDGTSNAVIIP
nr:cadherin-like beta sandwich domain-containing protein [Paenibacillus sp. SYP-B3998]